MLVIPFFIHHLGCPHRCLFCDQRAIASGDREAAEPADERLRRTIDTWLEYPRTRGAVQLAFFGGSFSCLPRSLQQQLLSVVRPYLQQGRVQAIRLSTRPDCVDPDVIAFLYSQGVRVVEVGAQSMDDRVLAMAERGHDSEQTVVAVEQLVARGMQVGVQLMVGLPGETTGSFLRGVNRVVGLAPAFVRLYPALVLEGTGLARLYRQGRYHPLRLARAVALAGEARERFVRSGITVIRIGLQPSSELEGRVLAGPYHPAFGELVRSRTWYRRLRPLLVSTGPGRTVALTICPRDVSALTGEGKHTINRLRALPGGAGLTLSVDDTLKRDQYHYAIG